MAGLCGLSAGVGEETGKTVNVLASSGETEEKSPERNGTGPALGQLGGCGLLPTPFFFFFGVARMVASNGPIYRRDDYVHIRAI